jgi:hypothetical protein
MWGCPCRQYKDDSFLAYQQFRGISYPYLQSQIVCHKRKKKTRKKQKGAEKHNMLCLSAFLFGSLFRPEDGSGNYVWNTGKIVAH